MVRAQVIGEVQGGLDAWEAGDRWKVQGITRTTQTSSGRTKLAH